MFTTSLVADLQLKFHRWAGYLTAMVIIIALLVLAGWYFNLDFLKRPLPKLVAMNPTTALSFVFSGTALFLLNSKKNTGLFTRFGYFLAVTVTLVSLVCILNIIFKLNIHPDRVLFSGRLAEDALNNIPNRMAPNTCVCFLLAGTALLLLHYESPGKKNPSEYFAIMLSLLSLFSMLGYLYNVPSFYGIQSYIPMALHTAFCFFFLSLALLFSKPDRGLMQLLTGKLIGSTTTRLLIPFAVLIPALLGLFSLFGLRAGMYNAEFSAALLVLSIIVVFAFIIWYNAGLLNKRDLLRLKVEDQVKQFNEELEEQVREKTAEIVAIFERLTDGFIALDKNFCYTYVNKKIGELVHRDPALLVGKNIWEEFPEARGSRTHHAFVQAMQEQHYIVCSDYFAPLDLWQENHIYPSPDGLSVFIRDITEHKKAADAIKTLENQILEQKVQAQKKISRAIIKAQEEEKNRIGKELHDNVNQILASTKIYLGIAAKKNKDLKESLSYPMELIDSSIEEIRLLSKRQVTPLKNINLEELLSGLLSLLNKTGTVKTEFTYSVSNGALPDELKLNIYRIIQVQVNNIIKHSGAKNVKLSVNETHNTIEIITVDNGNGFDLNAPRSGIGISNMINRIESFNGHADIKSSPGNGCAISVIIPLKEEMVLA